MKATKTNRARLTIVVLGAFLLSFLASIIPTGLTQSARADSNSFGSDTYKDGWIMIYDSGRPPTTPQVLYNATTKVRVGHEYYGGTYYDYRGFLSFDTSAIPDDAVIQSVDLTTTWAQGSWWTSFAVSVYKVDYGISLDLADWDVSGIYQNVLMTMWAPSGPETVALRIDCINKTGPTDFMLKIDSSNFHLGYVEIANSRYVIPEWRPKLSVTYALYGAMVQIDMVGGTQHLLGTFPQISDWNLTYDLWTFNLASTQNTDNFTVTKNVTWEYQGSFPYSDVTVTSTSVFLGDVADYVTYTVWLTVPKVNPTANVHIAYFNAFTGEGFTWETLHLQICDGLVWDNATATDLSAPDFLVAFGTNHTVRVTDFFGNALVDYAFTANAKRVYLSIPVPVYSWQVINTNDAPVLMRIYWNNSGAPFEFFIAPHWVIERFLKGGDYTFMVTFYDTTGVAGETVYFNRTVPMAGLNASFTYISGTTLYEIVSSVQGVMARQEVITSLVSPSVVLVYNNLPLAPANIRSLTTLGTIALDPYLILEATTFQNGSGSSIEMGCPHPGKLGRSYTILTDLLTFSGPYDAQVLVNTSDGSPLFSSETLPASYLLADATNITIWSNQTITVWRATTWREVSEYAVNYYATDRMYQATLTFENDMALTFHSPYYFVGFPVGSVIDPDTVSVWDVDNDLPLTVRANFVVSSSGIHMSMSALNVSASRTFRLTFWDFNSTTGIGAPNLVAYSYVSKSLGDRLMKYTSVQWMNPWSVSYRGEIWITLNFTHGDNLLLSSVVVVDETTGETLRQADWVYNGRTVIILSNGVGTVPAGQGKSYGIYFTLGEAAPKEKRDFFFDAIELSGRVWYIGGVAVSIFLLAIIAAWVFVGYTYYRGKEDLSVFVIVVSLTIVGFYFRAQLT